MPLLSNYPLATSMQKFRPKWQIFSPLTFRGTRLLNIPLGGRSRTTRLFSTKPSTETFMPTRQRPPSTTLQGVDSHLGLTTAKAIVASKRSFA